MCFYKNHIFKSNTFKAFKVSFILIFVCIELLFYFKKLKFKHNNLIKKLGNFEKDDIPPELFEQEIFERIKNRFNGKNFMSFDELYFINGLIRKYKPKKLLEIGVCSGTVSATILNSIKDIKDAKLYSCDLEKKHYLNNFYEVGYVVKENFQELMDKWNLYTGNTTSAFIEKIGGNIDFVYIDTSHVMPGEVLNIIEILPFLKKNAIIVFDDIHHHTINYLVNLTNFYPCNNLLMSVLRGKKILFRQNNDNKDVFIFTKIGAVILDNKQEDYFFEYFYLLTNNWSYMPNKFEIDSIRNIVEKYYKPIFLSIFDNAIKLNYNHLKLKGLLQKDYILYTFIDAKRENPHHK